MMKILVTGGAGFIGSHVVDELLGCGHSVVVLDDFSTGSLGNLPRGEERLRIVEGSILDKMQALDALQGCNAVIHLAAIASVQASVDDPLATHKVNFDGTLGLLEAARQQRVGRFLFASSASVYGNTTKEAVTEDGSVSPLTPYAIDKLAGEFYLGHYCRTKDLATTSFRFFNAYGPRQNPSSPYSGVISKFAANALSGKVLDIFGDGGQTRDFVYVKDVSRVLVNALTNAGAIGKTVNVGTGVSVSLMDLAGSIGNILGRKLEVRHLEARPGDIRHSLADIKQLHHLFGSDAPVTLLQDGLAATITKGGEG